MITFSGSGEPTLHSGIGRIIDHIKERYPHYRVAVLTNGTMLRDPAVRRSIARADIVVPSLDAVEPGGLRPDLPAPAGITPESVMRGLVEFRKEFRGKLYLEIFIVPGVNDSRGGARAAQEGLRRDRAGHGPDQQPGPARGRRLGRGRSGGRSSTRSPEFFRPLPVEVIGKPAARARAAAKADNLA